MEKRKELGFNQVGMAYGIPILVSAEGANASESVKRVVEAKLGFATYQFLLTGLSSDSSLKGKFDDDGKTDTNFWIAGVGRDINHLVTGSQEGDITDSQEARILRLAESGMMQAEIAEKLGVAEAGVYYALKNVSGHGSKVRKKGTKKPPTSILCTFDGLGNLLSGKGDSIETTVRVSKGIDDNPLLFFVLRDGYARVGGARFVIAECNGRQFTTDFVARVVVGVPQ